MKKRNLIVAGLAVCILAGTTAAFSRTTYAANAQTTPQTATKTYTDAEVAQLLDLVEQQQSKISELEQDFVRLTSSDISVSNDQYIDNKNGYANCRRNGGGYGSCCGYRTFEN